MSGYTKLFASIIHSTIWQESKETKLVWITLLALKDRDGLVEASIPGLAKVAGVTVTECETALGILMAPDPYSRSKAEEGRRLREVPGGWTIINHDAYRDRESADDVREKAAERKRRQRERERTKAAGVTERDGRDGRDLSSDVRDPDPNADPDPDPEADSDAGAGANVTALIPCPPDLELTDGQKANVEMGAGIKPETVRAITVRFRGGYLGKPHEIRTLVQWRAGLNTAVCRDGLKVQRELAERPEGERPKTRAERDAEIAKQNAAVLRED